MAVLQPYCAVCDVSYVFPAEDERGAATLCAGTHFVCVPGRLEAGEPPPRTAPQGQIVTWDPPRRICTRVELTPETWTTDLELLDVGDGATSVTVTITREPRGGSRLLNRLQSRSMQQLVQRIVDSELAKLPAHVNQKSGAPRAEASHGSGQSSSCICSPGQSCR